MVALAAALAVASAPVPATLQEASFIAGHWLDALEVTLEKDGKAQPFKFDPVTRPP